MFFFYVKYNDNLIVNLFALNIFYIFNLKLTKNNIFKIHLKLKNIYNSFFDLKKMIMNEKEKEEEQKKEEEKRLKKELKYYKK